MAKRPKPIKPRIRSFVRLPIYDPLYKGPMYANSYGQWPKEFVQRDAMLSDITAKIEIRVWLFSRTITLGDASGFTFHEFETFSRLFRRKTLKYVDVGFKDFEFVPTPNYSYRGSYGDTEEVTGYELQIWGYRLETDKEFAARVTFVKREIATQEANKKAALLQKKKMAAEKKLREIALLHELKAKYGDI